MAIISDIQTAIQKMDKSGTRIIGCVVNGVKGRIDNERGAHPTFRRGKAQKNNQLLEEEEIWPEKQESRVMEDLMNLTRKPSSAQEDAPQERAPEKKKRGWRKKKAKANADNSPNCSQLFCNDKTAGICFTTITAREKRLGRTSAINTILNPNIDNSAASFSLCLR